MLYSGRDAARYIVLAMKIFLHKNFVKKYAKLSSNQKIRFKERRDIFFLDPFDPILNNHALAGEHRGTRSINVAGDLRVIYKIITNDTVLFIDIDTHSNLYG